MASRSLGVLTLDLVAKTGGFERGMDKAARTADKRMNEIARNAKRVGAIIGTALVAGAGIVAAGVQKAINRMDEMSKAAQRAQMPTEQFSQLAHAASLADVSIKDLQTAFGRLAKAQGDSLKTTSEQGRIFKALGIDVADASGKLRSTRDVFLEFADVFQRNKGSPEVMAAGMAIFGRSFQNLIPLLKDGKQGLQDAADEADRLGITLSTEAGKRAEEFNDNISRLMSTLNGFWQEVAVYVLPTLIDLTDEFVESAKEGNYAKTMAHGLADGIRDIASALRDLHGLFGVFGQIREALAASDRLAQSIAERTGVARGGEWLRRQFPELYKARLTGAAQDDGPRVRMITGSSGRVDRRDLRNPFGVLEPDDIDLRDPPKAGKAGKSQAEKDAEALARAYQSMNERLDEQNALFGKVGEAARVRYEIEHGSLRGLSQAQAQVLIQKAERNDLQREEHELFEKSMKLAEEEARAAKQLAERQASFVEDMEFELSIIGLTNKERARAIALRIAEADANTELGRTIIDLSDRYEDARKAQELWMEFQRSLGDAFVDLASGAKSLKDVLTDFFDSIAAAITRSIAESWAETITGWFKGASSGGGGGGGSWWQGLLQSFFGGGKASGGSVKGGMLYEVNEQGTEMFSAGGRDYLLAGTDGHITPAHKLGGSIVQNVQFLMPERPSPSTQSQIAQRTGIATQTAARRNG